LFTHGEKGSYKGSKGLFIQHRGQHEIFIILSIDSYYKMTKQNKKKNKENNAKDESYLVPLDPDLASFGATIICIFLSVLVVILLKIGSIVSGSGLRAIFSYIFYLSPCLIGFAYFMPGFIRFVRDLLSS